VAKKVKKTPKKKAKAPGAAVSKKKAVSKAKKAQKKTAAAKKSSPKKTSAKKAARPKTSRTQPRKPDKATKDERLTPEEIEGYRRLLLEKWMELLTDVSYIENEALRKSRLDAAGDLSSMPIHMADLGTDNFEQEFSLGLMDGERKILMEIVAALRRIKDGTFGICEGTGKTISKARLQANPWARYCIDYARMVEKGLIAEGDKVYAEPDESADELDDETDGLDEDFEDLDEEIEETEDVLDDDLEEDDDLDVEEDEDEEEDLEL